MFPWERTKITFFVNTYGIQLDGTTKNNALVDNDNSGFLFEIGEHLLTNNGSTLYLPLIISAD